MPRRRPCGVLSWDEPVRLGRLQPRFFLDLSDDRVGESLTRLLFTGDERPRRLAVMAPSDQHSLWRRDDRCDHARTVRCVSHALTFRHQLLAYLRLRPTVLAPW